MGVSESLHQSSSTKKDSEYNCRGVGIDNWAEVPAAAALVHCSRCHKRLNYACAPRELPKDAVIALARVSQPRSSPIALQLQAGYWDTPIPCMRRSARLPGPSKPADWCSAHSREYASGTCPVASLRGPTGIDRKRSPNLSPLPNAARSSTTASGFPPHFSLWSAPEAHTCVLGGGNWANDGTSGHEKRAFLRLSFRGAAQVGMAKLCGFRPVRWAALVALASLLLPGAHALGLCRRSWRYRGSAQRFGRKAGGGRSYARWSTAAPEEQQKAFGQADAGDAALDAARELVEAAEPAKPAPRGLIRSVVGAVANLLHNGEDDEMDDEEDEDGFFDDDRGSVGSADFAVGTGAEEGQTGGLPQQHAFMGEWSPLMPMPMPMPVPVPVANANDNDKLSEAIHEEEHEGNHVSVLGTPQFYSPVLDGDYRVSRSLPLVNGHLHWECAASGLHLYWKAPKWRIGPDLYSINNVAQLRVPELKDAASAVEASEWRSLLLPEHSGGGPVWKLKVGSSWMRCESVRIVPLGENEGLQAPGGAHGQATANPKADECRVALEMSGQHQPDLAATVVATAAALRRSEEIVVLTPSMSGNLRTAAIIAKAMGTPLAESVGDTIAVRELETAHDVCEIDGESRSRCCDAEVLAIVAPSAVADKPSGGSVTTTSYTTYCVTEAEANVCILQSSASEDGRLPRIAVETAEMVGLDMVYVDVLHGGRAAAAAAAAAGEDSQARHPGPSVLAAASVSAISLLNDGGLVALAMLRPPVDSSSAPSRDGVIDAGTGEEHDADSGRQHVVDSGKEQTTDSSRRSSGDGGVEGGAGGTAIKLGRAPLGMEKLWDFIHAENRSGNLVVESVVPFGDDHQAAVVFLRRPLPADAEEAFEEEA
eukprot:scaffold328_cov248-Pinguiococcus_pyrenoidosus.AAC.15